MPDTALQPGAVEATDCTALAATGMSTEIVQGLLAIQNTFQSTQGGLYLCQNNGPVVVTHPGADATNPRIDQIIVKVYDSETGGDSSDGVQTSVLAGTATAGATLENKNGAATLPSNSIRVADVLVPSKATKASEFTYRDRRPWAKGAWGARTWKETRTLTLNTRIELPNSKMRHEISINNGYVLGNIVLPVNTGGAAATVSLYVKSIRAGVTTETLLCRNFLASNNTFYCLAGTFVLELLKGSNLVSIMATAEGTIAPTTSNETQALFTVYEHVGEQSYNGTT